MKKPVNILKNVLTVFVWLFVYELKIEGKEQTFLDIQPREMIKGGKNKENMGR